MLLIGSKALQEQGIRIQNYDTDYICTQEEAILYAEYRGLSFSTFNDKKAIARDTIGCLYEFYFYNPLDVDTSNPWWILWYEAGNYISKSSLIALQDSFLLIDIPSIEFLLTIKYCHRFKDASSKSFNKTRDSIIMLEDMGYSKIDSEVFQQVEKLFCTKHPKLNVQAKDFFKESDGFYKYQHDDIHAAIVYPKEPAYKKIISGEVQCNMKVFQKLSYEDQVACAVEEAATLAIERYFVPKGILSASDKDLHYAFCLALQKVATRITSGIFREFCWRNYIAIISKMDYAYLYKFKTALESWRVQNFKEYTSD